MVVKLVKGHDFWNHWGFFNKLGNLVSQHTSLLQVLTSRWGFFNKLGNLVSQHTSLLQVLTSLMMITDARTHYDRFFTNPPRGTTRPAPNSTPMITHCPRLAFLNLLTCAIEACSIDWTCLNCKIKLIQQGIYSITIDFSFQKEDNRK